MTRLMRSTFLAAALLATTLMTGGCSSSIDSNDLRNNWSPELYSVAHSEEQYLNNTTRHRHNIWRQARDDWAMIWLKERNYRLTRYTLP